MFGKANIEENTVRACITSRADVSHIFINSSPIRVYIERTTSKDGIHTVIVEGLLHYSVRPPSLDHICASNIPGAGVLSDNKAGAATKAYGYFNVREGSSPHVDGSWCHEAAFWQI